MLAVRPVRGRGDVEPGVCERATEGAAGAGEAGGEDEFGGGEDGGEGVVVRVRGCVEEGGAEGGAVGAEAVEEDQGVGVGFGGGDGEWWGVGWRCLGGHGWVEGVQIAEMDEDVWNCHRLGFQPGPALSIEESTYRANMCVIPAMYCLIYSYFSRPQQAMRVMSRSFATSWAYYVVNGHIGCSYHHEGLARSDSSFSHLETTPENLMPTIVTVISQETPAVDATSS